MRDLEKKEVWVGQCLCQLLAERRELLKHVLTICLLHTVC